MLIRLQGHKAYKPEMPSHFISKGIVVGTSVGNGMGAAVGELVGNDDGVIAASSGGSCAFGA